MTQPTQMSTKIGVIQGIFAVIMALGFRVIVENTYNYFTPDFGLANPSVMWRNSPFYFLPILALVLVGIRFFWATINVRRYIERANRLLASATDVVKARRGYERNLVLIHVPFLILHGIAFYFCCHLVSDLLFTKTPQQPSFVFVIFYASYQLVNACWLVLLTRRFRDSDAELRREGSWIINNLAASSIGFALATMMFFWQSSDERILWIACAVFIASSFVDLYFTSYHYLEGPEQ